MTAQLLPLRDYQRKTIDALMKEWDSGHTRLACVLPTGAGKTVVFSHLTSGYLTLATNAGKRVVILAHTDELVDQAYKKLKAVAPHLRVGIVKAARNEVTSQVIVASVQSLRSKKRRTAIKNVGLVIVDECHHAAAKTYVDVLTDFGCMDGSTLAAGFTATLSRGDNKSLADIWQGVAYRRDIAFMIRSRYLINVRGKRIEVDDLDLKRVRKSGGDFQASSLGEAMEASLAPEVVAKAYVEHAGDRSGILFAPTVSAAYAFAEELANQGIKAETIHGDLPLPERRAIIERLNDGTTQVVSNCMVLTEGFDSPRVSCVVVARPTKVPGLYQQMVGRGLRVDPTRPYDEQDCLILDVVGASQVHGLASLIDLSEKPIKIKEDQLLTDAEDELDEEPGDLAPMRILHDGPTKAIDFDPLASASRQVWLKTATGVPFLSAGTSEGAVYVFIIPSTQPDADPGTYDVLWCCKSPYEQRDGKRGGVTEHVAVPLDTAFAWGEEVAQEMKPFGDLNTLSKSAAWRKGAEPSEKQKDYARSLGITVPAGATKGDVSALIDAKKASTRIDPIAAWFSNQQKESAR